MLYILVCVLGADVSLAVLAAQREEGILPCTAHSEQGVQYRKISWYKVVGSEFQGLVMKNLQNNHSTIYRDTNHSYAVGEAFSLLLPESARADCGTYQCTLWPPLGHFIQEGSYDYYPAGCVKPTDTLPMMPLPEAHCCSYDVRGHQLSWSVAAAVVSVIICGAAVCLYRTQKQPKMADTL